MNRPKRPKAKKPRIVAIKIPSAWQAKRPQSLLDVHHDILGRLVISLNTKQGAQTTLSLPLGRARELLAKLPDQVEMLKRYKPYRARE